MTLNRANLIGRTEVAKASSAIVQARAQYIGSDSYIWRSVQDADVRRMHRLLNGTVHRWDDPPIAEDPISKGIRHHPGEFPNCRCYAEPILPAVIT
jgi:SPP1 gp7 family putative phage head morphogenesis protein